MSLPEPTLALEASTRAVADARRWVADRCRDLGRDDLVDCAELAVSELVTNALLHGEPPITVSVRGTREHPRIEVADGSTRPPVKPSPVAPDLDDLDELDELLTTFGRGLNLVAMASTAWGAVIERQGKVVWFVPAAELGDSPDLEPVIEQEKAHRPAAVAPSETVRVELHGIDAHLFASQVRQYHDLRRELRLLSLAHESDYPLARDLSAVFTTFERQFTTGAGASLLDQVAEGGSTFSLSLYLAPEAGPIFATMLEMFDLADAFCRSQRLLSLERTPQQRAFQTWFLSEFVRQLAGELPSVWTPTAAVRAL